MGTNGRLSREQKAVRLLLEGHAVGKKVITTIQNYPVWRCQACQSLLFDYGQAV
jgi:hypothetical protein